ncbi:DUF397 domain-containing protein [Streptomyces sp. NPDC059590]|uniref:DUF397 domain-containing protein n=1 Tax=Streptomyces sp. NPDC059590 TaxID=3346877 RepID=UPI0036AE4E6A
MSSHIWQKSSYSGNAANCVNIATDGEGRVRIRESDAPDLILTTRPADFGVFIRAVKAGAFDALAGG